MGKCKDCRFWELGRRNVCGSFSVCYRIGLSDAEDAITELGKHVHGVVRTCADFGCIHFDEKPKERGPFAIGDRIWNGLYAIVFKCGSDDYSSPTNFELTKEHAENMCDWLNELWAERESDT